MTLATVTPPDRDITAGPESNSKQRCIPRVAGRRAGRLAEIRTIARRYLVVAIRDPQALIPNLFVGLFFLAVNVGSFQKVAPQVLGLDVKSFQLPVAIMFAVTNISRAPQVVLDIERGLFDRLLVTPMRRSSLLIGMIVADVVVVVVLAAAIIALGLAWGVHFATGVAGIGVLLLMALGWAVAYCGFPYAIAFKTRSPDAVNAAGFMLFFPFAFLTTALLPERSLAGWMQPIARANPVTYFLSGARDLIATGWNTTSLLRAAAAIAVVATLGLVLASRALAGLIAGEPASSRRRRRGRVASTLGTDLQLLPPFGRGQVVFMGGNKFSLRGFFTAIPHVRRMTKRLKATKGFVTSKVWYRFPATIGTIAVFEDYEALRKFTRSPEHVRLMRWGADDRNVKAGYIRLYDGHPTATLMGDFIPDGTPLRKQSLLGDHSRKTACPVLHDVVPPVAMNFVRDEGDSPINATTNGHILEEARK